MIRCYAHVHTASTHRFRPHVRTHLAKFYEAKQFKCLISVPVLGKVAEHLCLSAPWVCVRAWICVRLRACWADAGQYNLDMDGFAGRYRAAWVIERSVHACMS